MTKNLLFLSFLFLSCFSFSQTININVITNSPSCWNACCGELEVFATGTNPPFSYQWSNGVFGSNIQNLVTGVYTVTVTDNDSHTASQTFELEDLPVEHELIEVVPQSCFGENDAILQSSVIHGLPPFIYRVYDSNDSLIFFSSTTDSLVQFENLAGGANYRVVVTDKRICSKSHIISTTAKTAFTVDAGNDVNILLGNSTQLNPIFSEIPVATFWTPTTGLSCGDCPAPIVEVLENTCYVIEAINEEGCLAKDTICIEVQTTHQKNVIDKKLETEIFPNPVHDLLTIEGDFKAGMLLEIVDLMGKKIAPEIKIRQQDFITISLNNIPRGIYQLSIVSEKGEVLAVKKFQKI